MVALLSAKERQLQGSVDVLPRLQSGDSREAWNRCRADLALRGSVQQVTIP